ncbi:MAG TPA: heliorhodopsin HeR [Gaiellaceae bacterium]|nr:heliorhodopsin HeR [Gaiellaceae bacterium]
MTGSPASAATAVSGYRRLRVWNAALALVLGAQALLIFVLSNGFSLPITISFGTGPPGTPSTTNTVWNLPIGPAVALFLLLAAVDHGLMAAPRIHGWYERNLGRERNPARWWEYSVSASLMIVLIAMYTGISDLAALIAIFGVNAAMILFGLTQEYANPPGARVTWRPYIYGCIAGAVPWIAIAIQIGYAQAQTNSVPAFVFGIFASLFVLFMSFGANMALQYRRRGPWRSYLFGERAYLVLSLSAKSLLAWQIFFPTLM